MDDTMLIRGLFAVTFLEAVVIAIMAWMLLAVSGSLEKCEQALDGQRRRTNAAEEKAAKLEQLSRDMTTFTAGLARDIEADQLHHTDGLT